MLDLIVPLVVSSIIVKLFMDWWINTAPKLGFKGRDMNKPGEVYAVEASGVWVILSIVFGIMSYIAIERYGDARTDVIPILSITSTLLLAGLLGFFDDILGWKKGISPLKRVVFTIPVSLPLVVVKAGSSTIELPFIGVLDLGLIYPLVIIPIGVLGAANGFNMIAGYNGLEASQSIILFLYMSILSYLTGRFDAIYITVPTIAAITVFLLLYNKYPAKAFPGNSFTYGIGALYATIAIYWNLEKYAVLSFTLYFIELLLFLRGLKNGVYKENFGIPQEDGSLKPPYDKSYSLTHIAIRVVTRIKGKCYEKDVVLFIALFQTLVCSISLLLVYSRIL